MKLKDLLKEAEVDMMGKKCKTCGKGVYKETSHMDDMKGVLHCSKCGAEINRYMDSKKANSKKDTDSKKELDTIKTIGGDKMLKIAQSLVDKGYDMEDITSFLKKHLKF